MLDTYEREWLVKEIEWRIEAKLAKRDWERTKRMFPFWMAAIYIVYAIAIFTIAYLT